MGKGARHAQRTDENATAAMAIMPAQKAMKTMQNRTSVHLRSSLGTNTGSGPLAAGTRQQQGMVSPIQNGALVD